MSLRNKVREIGLFSLKIGTSKDEEANQLSWIRKISQAYISRYLYSHADLFKNLVTNSFNKNLASKSGGTLFVIAEKRV